jgi:hypothetical protein
MDASLAGLARRRLAFAADGLARLGRQGTSDLRRMLRFTALIENANHDHTT